MELCSAHRMEFATPCCFARTESLTFCSLITSQSFGEKVDSPTRFGYFENRC